MNDTLVASTYSGDRFELPFKPPSVHYSDDSYSTHSFEQYSVSSSRKGDPDAVRAEGSGADATASFPEAAQDGSRYQDDAGYDGGNEESQSQHGSEPTQLQMPSDALASYLDPPLDLGNEPSIEYMGGYYATNDDEAYQNEVQEAAQRHESYYSLNSDYSFHTPEPEESDSEELNYISSLPSDPNDSKSISGTGSWRQNGYIDRLPSDLNLLHDLADTFSDRGNDNDTYNDNDDDDGDNNNNGDNDNNSDYDYENDYDNGEDNNYYREESVESCQSLGQEVRQYLKKWIDDNIRYLESKAEEPVYAESIASAESPALTEPSSKGTLVESSTEYELSPSPKERRPLTAQEILSQYPNPKPARPGQIHRSSRKKFNPIVKLSGIEFERQPQVETLTGKLIEEQRLEMDQLNKLLFLRLTNPWSAIKNSDLLRARMSKYTHPRPKSAPAKETPERWAPSIPKRPVVPKEVFYARPIPGPKPIASTKISYIAPGSSCRTKGPDPERIRELSRPHVYHTCADQKPPPKKFDRNAKLRPIDAVVFERLTRPKRNMAAEVQQPVQKVPARPPRRAWSAKKTESAKPPESSSVKVLETPEPKPLAVRKSLEKTSAGDAPISGPKGGSGRNSGQRRSSSGAPGHGRGSTHSKEHLTGDGGRPSSTQPRDKTQAHSRSRLSSQADLLARGIATALPDSSLSLALAGHALSQDRIGPPRSLRDSQILEWAASIRLPPSTLASHDRLDAGGSRAHLVSALNERLDRTPSLTPAELLRYAIALPLPTSIRSSLQNLAHEPGVLSQMTAPEFVEFVARLPNLPPSIGVSQHSLSPPESGAGLSSTQASRRVSGSQHAIDSAPPGQQQQHQQQTDASPLQPQQPYLFPRETKAMRDLTIMSNSELLDYAATLTLPTSGRDSIRDSLASLERLHRGRAGPSATELGAELAVQDDDGAAIDYKEQQANQEPTGSAGAFQARGDVYHGGGLGLQDSHDHGGQRSYDHIEPHGDPQEQQDRHASPGTRINEPTGPADIDLSKQPSHSDHGQPLSQSLLDKPAVHTTLDGSMSNLVSKSASQLHNGDDTFQPKISESLERIGAMLGITSAEDTYLDNY
ncbi:uncharacterized protein BJ171DRAFT_635598 [Polychytrium aggregatum]|uniref:uncharacterized protein n=1 Tax=Polychytrium aggregatum TaxID=110093 RepID=UPI0022FE8A11|nr:uncharacterized protein BJ171DRAFT_635598 [Polychytrium aggregatum]KAI9193574.1 hypothetical protein BJ171DRAFT_635598 [Polychytrium aggregatum]